MKFTHTPAPWKVVSGSVYSNDDIPIAHMERDANKARGIPPVERDRNAHLIAAAPELENELINLINLINELDYTGFDFGGESAEEWTKEARAVLEKANR